MYIPGSIYSSGSTGRLLEVYCFFIIWVWNIFFLVSWFGYLSLTISRRLDPWIYCREYPPPGKVETRQLVMGTG